MERYTIKCVFIGDSGVGKSSILSNYITSVFCPDQQTTLGASFWEKTIYDDKKTYNFQFWDTAGQEKFRSQTPTYIKDANVAVIVYDVTNRNSFDGIEKWIRDVQEHRGEEAVLAVVGNKCDLESNRY